MRCLVGFKLTCDANALRPAQEPSQRLGTQGTEVARGIHRLLQNLHRVATGNYRRGGQIHRILQALDGGHRIAAQDHAIGYRLHSQNAHVQLGCNRDHLAGKAVEVGIHYVQRHLHRVEGVVVLAGDLDHMQMDLWTLMAGEPDKPHLAFFPRLLQILQRPSGREDPLRIVHTNDLMNLNEVQMIGLQAAEGLLQLLPGRRHRAPIDLGHQERLLAIAVAERFAHADFAQTGVVVPAVIQEIDPGIERHAHNPARFLIR